MDKFKLTPSCFRYITPKIETNKKFTDNVTNEIYLTGKQLSKFWTFDLLWVDIQGAEKLVFDGFGDVLENVKAICTEVELSHMYSDSILKHDLDDLLKNKGFIEVQTYHMGDKIKSLNDLIENIGECDVIYLNKKFINDIN